MKKTPEAAASGVLHFGNLIKVKIITKILWNLVNRHIQAVHGSYIMIIDLFSDTPYNGNAVFIVLMLVFQWIEFNAVVTQ